MASRQLGRSRACFSGLALVLGIEVFLSSRGGAAAPPGLLDPATGKIDGKVAIAYTPAELVGDKLSPLSPWGFQAHLTGHDDPSVDLVFPCGVWFQPPVGRYRVWLEGEWQISPHSSVTSYSGQPFRGRGLFAALPVVEAGRVTLPPDLRKDPHLVLRLLHAGSHLEGNFPRWELSRRKPVREVGDGLLMPVGPAIAALWDERSQSYTAISRPFEVEARKTVTVSFELPVDAAHLVVQVQRQALAKVAADTRIDVRLKRADGELPPDLEVALADRVYAVWYGVPPGAAELVADAKHGALESRKLVLAAGRIERLLGVLKPPLKLDLGTGK